MNDFLSKPFREAELFETMCSVLKIDVSQTRGRQVSGNGAINLRNQVDNETIFDLTELKRISSGDESFVDEMLRVFVENTTEGLGKMKESAVKGDWDKVGLYAHRLAAPCRHLGMKKIVKTLKEIENNTLNKNKLDTISQAIEQLDADLKGALKLIEKEMSRTDN